MAVASSETLQPFSKSGIWTLKALLLLTAREPKASTCRGLDARAGTSRLIPPFDDQQTTALTEAQKTKGLKPAT
jgi:hypothetical protein